MLTVQESITPNSKTGGEILPSGFANGDDGCPGALVIWDCLKIGFRTGKDGYRTISVDRYRNYLSRSYSP